MTRMSWCIDDDRTDAPSSAWIDRRVTFDEQLAGAAAPAPRDRGRDRAHRHRPARSPPAGAQGPRRQQGDVGPPDRVHQPLRADPVPRDRARGGLTGQAPAAVACRGLTKRFGGASGVLAVNGLNLDVPAGSVFGLLGPNGAGKTTTLRLITGLARPTGGTVAIDGVQVAGEADRGLGTRRSIGVLDQDPRYYGWMTGRELVVLAGRLQGLSSSDAAGRATETLDVVGLS